MKSFPSFQLFMALAFAGVSIVAAGQTAFEGYRVPIATDVFETSEDTTDIDEILSRHHELFKSTDSLQRAKDGYIYWFRLDFSADTAKFFASDTIYLVTGLLDDANLYYQRDDDILYTHFNFLTSENYHGSNVTVLTIPVYVNTLIDNRYIFLKQRYFRGAPNLHGRFYRYNTSVAELLNQNFVSVPSVEGQIEVFLFFGVAGVLFIFNVLLFYSNRDRQYLFYGAFLLWQIIYYTRGSPVLTHAIFGNHHYLQYIFTEASQVAANLSYLLFVKYFLETRRSLPILDWVIQFVAVGLFLFIAFDVAFLVIDPYFPYQTELMNAQRYFMAAFAAGGVIYLAVKGKGNLPYFIIAGTILYTGGALMTMFLLNLYFMILGSALENVIFALGISYKVRSIREERLKHEREVNQITLSALRAQMNPHFIFNSLNSIQHLISKNDRVNALKYLTKFSTLLRQILESSISVNVSISREIELLQIYLELEAFRFDNTFQYKIEVDKALDVHNVELPIMLLQPYVENSVAHGLVPKQSGEKRLTIRFYDDDSFVICVIEDTGIGRKAAMERKKALKTDRPSRGLELTKKRLGMINTAYDPEELIHIVDSDEGTTVEIRIPKN